MNAVIAGQADDHQKLEALVDAIETVFVGKREAVQLTLIALLAEGHVLFEDVPGVGKTTLARTFARALGCEFSRIQFTSDLLPADIIGVNIFNRDTQKFAFKKGPIFANLVLADEINRTTPRTQSALLEAMNEHQITVDDKTYKLEPPFVVLATQNPLEFSGTYPLPESQLDRFLVRVKIGYPDPEVEKRIVKTLGFRDATDMVKPALQAKEIADIQQRVTEVSASEPVQDYLQRLVAETRQSPYLELGISTRGAIYLHRAAQARAYLEGRDHILPDDVKALFLPVCSHRVMVKGLGETSGQRRQKAEHVLLDILESTAVPL